ncbi:hypothetical protein ACWKSP_24435 [Micromonosporaceae bacterium Da 78-11]
MRRQQVVASIGALVLIAGIAWWLRPPAEKETPPLFPVVPAVDIAAPESDLLQDALTIVAYRQAGSLNYALLPKNRPPDLLRMPAAGEDEEPVHDNYQFGDQKLFAMVTLSSASDDACRALAKDLAAEMCVRDGALGPGDERYRYLTVRLSGNVSTTPKDGDPETDRARRFWAGADMVPFDQAVWFTDLVTRAEAAVRR